MARIFDYIRNLFGTGDFIDVRSTTYKNTVGEIFFKELAIRQAVSIIAGVISKCEFKVYYGGKAADDSKEYYAWNINPNDNQNAAELKARIIEELLLTGNALVFENSNGRQCADSFNVEQNGTKPYLFSGVTVNGVSLQKPLKRKDVVYIKLNKCNITNMIDSFFNSYGAVLAAAITSNINGSGNKYKLKISAMAKASPDFKENYSKITQHNLKSFFEAANAVLPEYDGFDLQRVEHDTNAAKSSDIISLKKDIFNSVAGCFKIPLSIFNGEPASDVDRKRFKDECIAPIANIVATELTKQIFTYDEWKNGNRYEVDVTEIETLNISELAGASEKLIGSGLMNIDEVRVYILGLNPLNTEQSTKYWMTKNFADIEEMNTEQGGDEN